MKKRFLSILFVVLMLFNVCYAAPVSLNAKDLVKESSRTYIASRKTLMSSLSMEQNLPWTQRLKLKEMNF